MDGRSLELRFAALRRRVLLVGSFAAAGWMALVVFVLALVAAWFDLLWELSPQVRTGCDVLLIVAGAAALAIGIYRILIRSRWRSLARRLDRTAGTGGEILSGYELSREAFADSKSQPLTRGLAGIAVAQAAALAAGIPAHRVVPLATLRRMGIWLGVATVAAIGLLIFCPGLAETEVLRFGDPYGDHPPYSNIVFHVEPGNTRVLYGGGLDVAVSTEGPAPQRVELVLRDGQGQEEVLPMFQAGPGQWRTVLARVTSDSQYYARARRARSLRYAIEVITIPKLKNVRFRIAPPEYGAGPFTKGPCPRGASPGWPAPRCRFSPRATGRCRTARWCWPRPAASRRSRSSRSKQRRNGHRLVRDSRTRPLRRGRDRRGRARFAREILGFGRRAAR